MKILLLGNSNDTGNWDASGPRRHEIVRDRLAAQFGEPVDVVVKDLWPNERMVSLVGRWLDEVQPDLVHANVTSFPFSYESLPLRFKRLLGKFGPAVGDAGLRFADSKRWAHNAAFRTIRGWGQATIGGDTYYSCDEVLARLSDAFKLVIRHEDTVLVVKGPTGSRKTGITGRQHRREEARRLYVHRELQTLCSQLHVHYVGRETPLWREPQWAGATVGDGLHANARGQAQFGDDLFEQILGAWLESDAREPSQRA